VVGQPSVVGPGRGQPQPGGQPVVGQPPVLGPGRIPQKGGPAVVVGRPGPVPVNVDNLRDQRRSAASRVAGSWRSPAAADRARPRPSFILTTRRHCGSAVSSQPVVTGAA
jgi:hypothetical protein